MEIKNGVSWTLKGGVLTISGAGDMPNYAFASWGSWFGGCIIAILPLGSGKQLGLDVPYVNSIFKLDRYWADFIKILTENKLK
jgi:hypothetical protein